ncbi:hypothetical protein ACFXJO_15745 [Streptomyces lavendulae]
MGGGARGGPPHGPTAHVPDLTSVRVEATEDGTIHLTLTPAT